MRPGKKLTIAEVIGNNIKKIRVSKNLKVRDLAAKMNVAVQSWYKWERGEVVPEDENQLRIASCLGVSMDDIRRGIGGLSEGADHFTVPDDDAYGSGKAAGKKTDIPVIGLVACGVTGWYSPRPLAVRAPLPIAYDNPDNLFAVLAVGDSMNPDGIREGYLLYCDGMARPESGDAVYVRTHDGNATVKRFIRLDDEWLTLQGWLDPDKGGMQKPFTKQYATDFVDFVACVIMVRRKA